VFYSVISTFRAFDRPRWTSDLLTFSGLTLYLICVLQTVSPSGEYTHHDRIIIIIPAGPTVYTAVFAASPSWLHLVSKVWSRPCLMSVSLYFYTLYFIFVCVCFMYKLYIYYNILLRPCVKETDLGTVHTNYVGAYIPYTAITLVDPRRLRVMIV